MAIWNYRRDTREQVALTLRNLGLSDPVRREKLWLDPAVHPFRVVSRGGTTVARFRSLEAARATAYLHAGAYIEEDSND